ncbi:hypothetical protein HGM15179_019203 [Zosterops borbonicus]|uniref:Uncharacterized protein n=1 Tax=Zosterops borbonicus TaxID=364589 RepID=A0A8K1DB90_9PASS|nr:hypothetical protein HGM15179_019203 [Zosterops borbonicus]
MLTVTPLRLARSRETPRIARRVELLPLSLFLSNAEACPLAIIFQWQKKKGENRSEQKNDRTDLKIESDATVIVIEWVFLPVQPKSRVMSRTDAFAALIMKGRDRIVEIDGKEPADIGIPARDEDLEWLLRHSVALQEALLGFAGKTTQLPQSFLIGLVFQAPHQPCCPSLDMLKCRNILPKLRGPELDTVLRVRPHQCQVQGKNDLPAPAGHTTDTDQDAVSLVAHQGTLLAHVQFAVDQYPKVPFCLDTVQPHHLQPIMLQRVIVAKMHDSALGLIKLHLIGFCPSIHPTVPGLSGEPSYLPIDQHRLPA